MDRYSVSLELPTIAPINSLGSIFILFYESYDCGNQNVSPYKTRPCCLPYVPRFRMGGGVATTH